MKKNFNYFENSKSFYDKIILCLLLYKYICSTIYNFKSKLFYMKY